MERGLLLRYPAPGWPQEALSALCPGGHAVVYGDVFLGVLARGAGFEVRDCLFVIGPKAHLIWLLRKPLEEPSLAQQMLATGTGGLNIDGSRVGAGGGGTTCSFWPGHCQGHTNDVLQPTFHGSPPPGWPNLPTGRWPTNMALLHAAGCHLDGVRKIRGSEPTPSGFDRLNKANAERGYRPGSYPKGAPEPSSALVDAEGLEAIPDWTCAEDCLVVALDDLSLEGGTHAAGFAKPWHGPSAKSQERRVGDVGGASRFFPQFGTEAELDEWLMGLILGPRGG